MASIRRFGSACARFVQAVIAGCALAAAFAASGQAADFDAIDGYVRREMARAGIPGAALAIVKGDRIVHVAGYGAADPSGRPVTPDTPFILGSTGKSITALAVMQLVEAGRVELDAPAQRYLPWFRLRDADASARITVRHLLNQTSGIPTAAGLALQNDPDTGDAAIERHVRALAAYAPSGAPGERFEYSNGNYTTLGMLIQAVTGQFYEDYVRQRIFAPLGMERSFLSKDEARAHGLATGHRHWLGRPVAAPDLPYVRGELPAGYHISTAADMARLLIANLNGGRYGERSVLGPEAMAELHRPGIEAAPGIHYAMGWRVETLEGVPAVTHGGAIPNYLSDMILLPEQGWGIVLLANASNALFGMRMLEIGDNVARMLLGKPPVEPSASPLPWVIFGVLGAVLMAQVAMIARKARSGRKGSKADSPLARMRRAGLPLALNGALAALLWLGLPALLGGAPLRVVLLFQPDLGTLLVTSGGIALAWGTVQAGLALLRPAA